MKLYVTLLFALLLSLTTLGYSQDIFRAIEVRDKRAISQWLKNKPDLNVVNDQGQTVLVVAVQAGNKSLIHRLLRNNVDVNALDKNGETALDYAAKLGHKQIILELASKNAKVSSIVNLEIVQDIIESKLEQAKNFAFLSGLLGVLSGLSYGIIHLLHMAYTAGSALFLPLFLLAHIAIGFIELLSFGTANPFLCFSLPVLGLVSTVPSLIYWEKIKHNCDGDDFLINTAVIR